MEAPRPYRSLFGEAECVQKGRHASPGSLVGINPARDTYVHNMWPRGFRETGYGLCKITRNLTVEEVIYITSGTQRVKEAGLTSAPKHVTLIFV